MRRAVLTGATGFVGANLAQRLVHDGHELHLLVRQGYSSWRIVNILDEVQVHKVDLSDVESLTAIITSIRPDWIFHLAVYGAYSYQTDPSQMIQTNIVGTNNLLQASCSTDFEAFVNTGSSSEYGFKYYAPTEQEWLEPNSYYAVTKASATMLCRFTAQSRKLHIPTLRLYSVYGPYESPSRLMPTLIAYGLRGELPPLVSPDVARDYIYIDDVISAYLLAASHPEQEPGAVYNIGSGRQLSLQDVVEIARHVLSIKAEPQWGSMPNRDWDTGCWIADNRTAHEKLGWQPRHTFEQGIRLMVDWSRSRG